MDAPALHPLPSNGWRSPASCDLPLLLPVPSALSVDVVCPPVNILAFGPSLCPCIFVPADGVFEDKLCPPLSLDALQGGVVAFSASHSGNEVFDGVLACVGSTCPNLCAAPCDSIVP
ncbi:hypothetical protein SUGI_0993500 [Cryptomeria japonica]|nr:hypothetical protein SUGI_0993500 [Cryptomeria japonica]